MSVSAFRTFSTSARSGGVSSGVSCTAILRPAIRQIRLARWPYAPLTSSSTLPERGTKVVSIASTAKVPEPCIGTVVCVPLAFTTSGRRSNTSLLILRNVASREPQSCTITSLTRLEVVSGPGVKSNGSPVSDDQRTASGLAMKRPQPIDRQRAILELHEG